MVSTTTLESGTSSRIRRAAPTPSNPRGGSRQVHQHDVGPGLDRQGDRLLAVVGLADHVLSGALEPAADAVAQDLVVVGQQHPHDATSLLVSMLRSERAVVRLSLVWLSLVWLSLV